MLVIFDAIPLFCPFGCVPMVKNILMCILGIALSVGGAVLTVQYPGILEYAAPDTRGTPSAQTLPASDGMPTVDSDAPDQSGVHTDGALIPSMEKYPIHRNITATIFWIGEPQGGGSSENNALSAWDDAWQEHYGGVDDPFNRNGYHPASFIPKENPFYLDLPYNDFDNDGKRKTNASELIPWANEKEWGRDESMLKNRWVKLTHKGNVCYGQIQDAGPYEYDDHAYVFGNSRPKTTLGNNAGMDVSPALRDCLAFEGLNNADNKVDWQFVDNEDVPVGPWKDIVTTSGTYWR